MNKNIAQLEDDYGVSPESLAEASGSLLPPVGENDKDKFLHTNASTGEKEWSEASGGYFVVNVIPTYTSLQVTGATVDKTYSEVLAAINAGTPVLVLQRPNATGNVINIGTAECTYSITYLTKVIVMHIPDFGYDVVLRPTNQVELAAPNSLPGVSSINNGAVLTVVNGAWAAAGTNIFVVTYDMTTSKSDKTYSEITQAINAGRTVVGRLKITSEKDVIYAARFQETYNSSLQMVLRFTTPVIDGKYYTMDSPTYDSTGQATITEYTVT